MTKKTRILIADDHAMVRQGIASFLSMSPEFEVVGEAADGVEAIEAVKRTKPDIVLMDISMPRLGGLEATLEIKKSHPGVKVLVLTQYEDMVYIKRFFKAGASGYLLKKAVGEDLLTAIRSVIEGKVYVHPSIASGVVDGYLGIQKGEPQEDPYDLLTDREKQVLKLIAEGHTHKEAADILNISAKTVIAHQTNLSEKLKIHSRAGLIKFSIQKGIIKIE
jgi:DNA-binding NarL/FixJ family response regulator